MTFGFISCSITAVKKTINFSFIRPFSLLYLHCLCQGAVVLLSRGFCWGATLWIKRKYLQGHSKDGSLCDTSANVSLQEPWGCQGRFTELLIAELILPDVWRQPCWLARHTDPARDSQNAETGWTNPYFFASLWLAQPHSLSFWRTNPSSQTKHNQVIYRTRWRQPSSLVNSTGE